VLHVVDARPDINEGSEHRTRAYVFDALAIDPDLEAIADRMLSRAYHRVPCRVSTGPIGEGRQHFQVLTYRVGGALSGSFSMFKTIGPGLASLAATSASNTLRLGNTP
jgi:hypothetical protein